MRPQASRSRAEHPWLQRRRGERRDDGIEQITGAADHHAVALVLKAIHLGQLHQQRVIERTAGIEPHVIAAALALGQPTGVSIAITRPESISATRSHNRSASSMKCVTRTIVTPRSLTLSISPHVSRRACGSSPVVSSSRIATFGLPIKRQGDREPLLLPTREALVIVIALGGQAEQLEQLPGVRRAS